MVGDGESVNHIFFSCTLARQVWALSGFPHPLNGYHETSVYVNFSYILETWRSNVECTENTKRFPWILWYLWKNRNSLLFEEFLYDGDQTWKKAFDEANLWSLAQEVAQSVQGASLALETMHRQEWCAPPHGFVKCNVGTRWSKKTLEVGAAWVLRDSRGTILLHSRRSFSRVRSKAEAYFLSVVWAVESMVSHKCQQVYFAFEWGLLVNAINRPRA